MPTTELELDGDSIGVMDLLVRTGLAASKSEARRLVQQGGIVIDEKKVEGLDAVVTREALTAGVRIRKGKKVYHKVILK